MVLFDPCQPHFVQSWRFLKIHPDTFPGRPLKFPTSDIRSSEYINGAYYRVLNGLVSFETPTD